MEVPITNTTIIYVVSKNNPVPPIAQKVRKETSKTFVLEDGTVVRKADMSDAYRRYFTENGDAETYYRVIAKPLDAQNQTNIDIIHNSNSSKLANILFDMIQELCEDGMPTKAEIENWLNAKV